MSDELYEVSFAGVIRDGEDPAEVRAKVGKMFNADDAKLAQLFSGKRIVIKKNIDEATAAKYRTALTRAGAECEVRPMGGGSPAPAASEPSAPEPAAPPPSAAPAAAVSQVYESQYDGEVAPPPQTDPLGITGDQIDDLAATIAPVGSELQDDYQEADEPQIDISGLDMAPVGADLSDGKREPEPPPPDTTGITMDDS